jgi:ABC-type arginine transport system ATPase subunit
VGEYDIITKNDGHIKEIKSKQYGLVRHIAQCMDQECGYVLGSKVEIYTEEFNKTDMLNIVHMHINDMSEEVTVSVFYMEAGHSVKDFY